MQVSSRARPIRGPILSMLEHRPLHQELRLGRGNRDILYMLEHRPLHQDVRRNTGRERASGHLSCTCWGIGPCIRMSGAKTPRGCASRVALHRNDDAPNAAKAAGGGGVAAGAGDEEAAGADDGAAAEAARQSSSLLVVLLLLRLLVVFLFFAFLSSFSFFGGWDPAA